MLLSVLLRIGTDFTHIIQRNNLEEYGLGHGGAAVLLPGFAINW